MYLQIALVFYNTDEHANELTEVSQRGRTASEACQHVARCHLSITPGRFTQLLTSGYGSRDCH